jgi:imidazolonepropionase-like amidohydrolase
VPDPTAPRDAGSDGVARDAGSDGVARDGEAGRAGEPPVLRLTGRMLLGPETVVDELWVVGGRITFTRPTGPLATSAQHVEGWVLPGLVDAHCHVGLGRNGAVPDEVAEQQASTDRDAGTLLIRDAGQPGDTRWVDRRADLPVIVRAGRHIARSRRYLRNYGHEIEPEELARYVRAEARHGDGWVKLVGDWIDRDLGDLAPCWPADALHEAIAVAHAEGARVTAHCFAEDSLPDLLAAGIDCIEHGTGLTDQTRAVAAARGVPIVPTLVNIATFPHIAEAGQARFPGYSAHMRELHARRYDTVREAYQAGIPIYVGTDAGGSLPHGLVAAEVAELVTAGLPPLAALDAASWSARAWLGHPGLDEGAPADLVVYDADPRADVGVLGHPRLVVLRGRPMRSVG